MTKLVFITFIAITVVVAVFPSIVFAVVKPISTYCFNSKIKFRPYGIATLIMLALWFLLFAYGMMYGRFRYEITTFEYHYSGYGAPVPQGFDGYRIAVFSDLHLDGWVGHEERLKEIIDTLTAQHADAIFFTGDIVSLSGDEITDFIPLLRQIKARDGVFAVMGNHDYMPYDGVPPFHSEVNHEGEVHELERIMRDDIGWNLLLNENKVVHHKGDSIAILGCENQSLGVHHIIQRGNLTKTMRGTDGMFRILLTHDPTQWDGEVVGKTDIPLTFSGHTHAGQLNVYGISPANLFLPRLRGFYAQGNQTLYVNPGLGAAMPMRIGATPEITVITLRR